VAPNLLTDMRGLEHEQRLESYKAIAEEEAMHLQTMERSQDRVTRDREEEKMPGAPGTILFVEDEAFVRDVTCEVLQSAGYRVLSATNAAEAMRLYDQHCGEVDFLLSDVVLPGESGWTLARKLRRENPFLKILLVTGYAEQMGLKGAKPEEFLAKPFSTETLLQSVRQLLGTPVSRSNRRNKL